MNRQQREQFCYNIEAPKKRLNVTVNEDLVRAVQECTDNLSGTIEEMLNEFVLKKRKEQWNDEEHWAKVNASWNAFYEKYGCFADEYNQDYRPVADDEDAA